MATLADPVAVPAFLSGRKLSPSSCLDARYFQFLTVGHWCLSSCYPGARAQRSESKFVCGFFNRNCFRLQEFLSPTQSLLASAARSYGDLSPWHCNPGLGTLVWDWDSSLLRYPS